MIIPHIESFGISDIGSRSNNEDVWVELPDDHFYALADGMGGHLAGEVAAKESVLHLCDSVEKFLRTYPHSTPAAAKGHLRKAFAESNSWVRSLSVQHPDLSGMGTTLCCMLILDSTLIYAHVGDSRIYRYRGKLEKLTQDHSRREEMLAQGEMAEQSDLHKNKLTRAVGISTTIEPVIQQTTFEPGDIYFLCSDGLHDPLSDRQIETILRRSFSLKEAAVELVDAAKKAGGTDNITLLMVKNSG